MLSFAPDRLTAVNGCITWTSVRLARAPSGMPPLELLHHHAAD
jgi:hypothetical protein